MAVLRGLARLRFGMMIFLCLKKKVDNGCGQVNCPLHWAMVFLSAGRMLWFVLVVAMLQDTMPMLLYYVIRIRAF
ncbi:hypothetical protein D3C78_1627350 [compost metagenome]